MRLWRKFNTFLNMTPREGAEFKDLAVFIRSLSIIFLFYFVLTSVALFATTYFVIAVIECFCAGFFIITYILTYRGKTNFAMGFFGSVIVAAPTILTLVAGWKTNFQWCLIVEILVLYFNLNYDKETKKKLFWVISVTFVATALFSHILPNSMDFTKGWGLFFHLITAAFYAGVINIIAFFYSNKFNAAEENLRDVNLKLRHMAATDALTGLRNRRDMNEYLKNLAYTYERNNVPFTIAIADIDFFKRINDTYGHDAGDYILKEVAGIFTSTMNNIGTVARWGGEEFLFVFENASGTQAKAILEGMRSQIEKKVFLHKDDSIHLTVTLGVEDYSPIIGIEAVISKADTKLYRGKQNGRNCVVY